MTGAQWQWRDGGSGSGHLQRVASSGVYARSQKAYRAYLAHRSTCADCAETRCQEAEELWRAYQKEGTCEH